MSPAKLLAPIVIVVTVIVVGAALYVSGSPMEARRGRFDTQRVNDLQQMSYAIDNFWLTKQRLPTNLQELREGVNGPGSSYYFNSSNDPHTGAAYEYQWKERTGHYELCSTFETTVDTSKNQTPYNGSPPDAPFWHHTIGRVCFPLQVHTLDQKPFTPQ